MVGVGRDKPREGKNRKMYKGAILREREFAQNA